MAISFGPKLGLLYNALINESYYDSLRLFLQNIDQLVNGSVINATQITPPTSPNPGDAYLLIGGTPGGAWTGQAGKIAFWDAQLTQSGTNNVIPNWVFLTPLAGWLIWNVATATLIVYNGTSWIAAGGGANFPVNTDITSMTGLTNQTIQAGGYVYNDGTDPIVAMGAITDAGANQNGFRYGSGAFTTGENVIIGYGPWSGIDLTGIGVGVSNTTGGATVITAGGGGTSGGWTGNFITSLGVMQSWGDFQCGPGSLNSLATITPRGSQDCGLQFNTAEIIGLQTAFLFEPNIGAPANGKGLIGFGANYGKQTTVGAAGGASALPATPKGYLQFTAPDGTVCVFPYYAAS